MTISLPITGTLSKRIQKVAAGLSRQGGDGGIKPRIDNGMEHGGVKPPLLTAREEEILGLLDRRLSNKQIATALGNSVATVKFHLAHIFAKLGVNDRHSANSRSGTGPDARAPLIPPRPAHLPPRPQKGDGRIAVALTP
jgi:DNA-binding NarL/FixJ family response regulator